jgi:predicted N-acyltransferase
MRLFAGMADIPADAWDRLLCLANGGVLHPALRHAYMAALETSGSACAQTGWVPRHLGLLLDERLVAVAPLYVKSHSYGEYVFDWAWAQAYEQHGLDYFPKLLSAIPFTPVFGPRLLAEDADTRRALLQALLGLAEQAAHDPSVLGVRISSWHGLFFDAQDQAAVPDQACLRRQSVQFHWKNHSPRSGRPYSSFDDFLEQLQQKKRKNIRAEIRKVSEANVVVRAVEGSAASIEDWDFFYGCHCNTYAQRGSRPYLTRAFFHRLATEMPEQIVLFIAWRGGARVAASFCLHDTHALYGRYWGYREDIPCLHFETAYYAPLRWAIDRGMLTFEGGAQGEHKWARGFEPTTAVSYHWLAHPDFNDAVERYLAREDVGVARYIDELQEHSPFKGAGG